MTIGKLGNHQRDKSQHHSRAQSHVSHSTKKFIKWIRKIPSKRQAHRKLLENAFGAGRDNPLHCSPEESVDSSLLPQYAHSYSTTVYSGVMISDVSACLGYSDVHVSLTNYGPHVMSTYGGSLCESGLHSFQTEQCVCGDSSSPRRTLESPFTSHGHFTAHLLHHYHPQPVAHTHPQIIHGSATEGQHNHGSSHPHYHLTSKSHMHQCVGAEPVAHRRTKSLPDSIITPVATESLDTSKPSMPISCECTKSLPDLSTHMTTDIMLDTQNQPSTPVRCKPVLLGENTTASEPFSATGYHLAPNLQLLKESSISSDNIGVSSYPHLFIKKRHRSKKARRRSRMLLRCCRVALKWTMRAYHITQTVVVQTITATLQIQVMRELACGE